MGTIFCLPGKEKTLRKELNREPTFMKGYNMNGVLNKTNSKVFEEDKDHFFENEAWFQEVLSMNKNVSFIDLHKFIEKYPHYKIDQVCFEKNFQ